MELWFSKCSCNENLVEQDLFLDIISLNKAWEIIHNECWINIVIQVYTVYSWWSLLRLSAVSGVYIELMFRDQIRSLMMMTKMVLETSVQYRHLTQLIAWEDFIEFSPCESSRTEYFLFPLLQMLMPLTCSICFKVQFVSITMMHNATKV